MAKTITAPVGRMGAINRPPDTRTVQELLNKVPIASAGPRPLLDVDGLCGPKTCGAIQTFQQRHFARADGRVDPNGPTLAKLNEFDSQEPPPNRALRTMTIRRVGRTGGFVDAMRPQEWYFEVRDLLRSNLAAVYFFGKLGEHRTLMTPIVFQGDAQTFETSRSLFDLESPASGYLTEYGDPLFDEDPEPTPRRARSRFTLVYLAASGAFEHVQIYTSDPLQPQPNRFPGLSDSLTSFNGQVKSGAFQFVRS